METDWVLFKLGGSGITSEIQGSCLKLSSRQDLTIILFHIHQPVQWSSLIQSAAIILVKKKKKHPLEPRTAQRVCDLEPKRCLSPWLARARQTNQTWYRANRQTPEIISSVLLYIFCKKHKNGTFCCASWVFQLQGGAALWPRQGLWRAAIEG